MFKLDFKSRIPIYEQLVQRIRQLIIQDVLRSGEKLPSVRSLAQELTINPNTIQKAYRELEREGYIYSLPGKGSFVNEMRTEINQKQIKMLSDELEKIIQKLLKMNVPKEYLKNLVEHADQGKEDINENGN
ncbi:GntR family transcriptional regulator [Salinicoccus carnicancri]|uniref:GntR family transcriptional regulator n=1 Tax=Salinicoccus carnicancri TaxID=558170 RepID=UPI0002D49108|nr:GntR family transcriptional regulator [Salinicoccus carnicancri]